MPVDLGTGGGSTTNICTTSPTDLQGQVDNLVSRVEELEKTVSQILGGNISVTQLSDISPSIGWVYDVTYMGTPGWTQTEYGSLIPPLGFTVSDILANAQANQMAIQHNGSAIGGGGASMAFFQSNGGSSFPLSLTWTTLQSQSFATNNTTSIDVAAGQYLLTVASAGPILRSGSVTSSNILRCTIGSFSGNNSLGFGAYWEANEGTTSARYVQGAMSCEFPDPVSDSTIVGTVSKSGTPTVTFTPVVLGIIKMNG